MTPALKNQPNLMNTAVLKRADAQNSPSDNADPADELAATAGLRKQAQGLVANTFFGTLLKQMHESPFKSELFSGGRGGEAYGGLYDQALVQRMSGGKMGQKLTRPIIKKHHDEALAAYRRQKIQKTKSPDNLKQEKANVPHDRRA